MSTGNKDIVVSIGADVSEADLAAVERQIETWADNLEDDLEIELQVDTQAAIEGADLLQDTFNEIGNEIGFMAAKWGLVISGIQQAWDVARGFYEAIIAYEERVLDLKGKQDKGDGITEEMAKAQAEAVAARAGGTIEELQAALKTAEGIQNKQEQAQQKLKQREYEVEQMLGRAQDRGSGNVGGRYGVLGLKEELQTAQEAVKEQAERLKAGTDEINKYKEALAELEEAQAKVTAATEAKAAADKKRAQDDYNARRVRLQQDIDKVTLGPKEAGRRQRKREEDAYEKTLDAKKAADFKHTRKTRDRYEAQADKKAADEKAAKEQEAIDKAIDKVRERTNKKLAANTERVEGLRGRREEVRGRQEKALGGFDKGLESIGNRIAEAANQENTFEAKKLAEIAKLNTEIAKQDEKRNDILLDQTKAINKLKAGGMI